MPQVHEAIGEAFGMIRTSNLTHEDAEEVCEMIYNSLSKIVPKIDSNIACYRDHVDILIGPKDQIDKINANIRVTFR